MSDWSQEQERHLDRSEEFQYYKDSNRGLTVSNQQHKDAHTPEYQ